MILHFLLLINDVFGEYSSDTELALISESSPRRQKRLVFGLPVLAEDQEIFPSTSYQSTIISAHYCNEGLLKVLQDFLKLNPGHYDPAESWKIRADYVKTMVLSHCPIHKTRAVCGGTAITEFVVQTTCHCIARFDTRAHDMAFGIPHAYNAWEDMLFMFVGGIEFDQRNTPYVSKDFIIHENCRQICNMTISHNFGLIVLRYKLKEGTKIAAPTTMSEMADQWYYIVERQVVCLVIGWGSETFEGENIYGLPSFLLRKSWQVVRSFTSCWAIHNAIPRFMDNLRFEKARYKELQTWSCLTDFGKTVSRLSVADSGGPVTCVADWLFAISNWAMSAITSGYNATPFSITTSSDVVYSFYENSWDYRSSFNKYIEDKQNRETAPTFRPYARGKSFDQTAKPESDVFKSNQRGDFHSLSVLLVCTTTLLLIFIDLF